MRQRELGRSGVSVSQIVLGCGNFGGVGSSPAFFGQGIPKDEAFRIMDAAWELGLTAFDTADAYGGGRSETWIGEWLAAKGPGVRDTITIETKTFNPMDTGQDRGLSRARVRRQIETSLKRLGVDRIALYLAHGPDPDTPQEETLQAFDELVRAGKVGAVGASNLTAEQLAEAVELSELEGLTRYEWVQNAFSLLDRTDAETVFPVCHEHALGYEAFSPLAGGWLSGKYRRGEAYPEGSRMTQRPESYVGYESDAVFDALEAFEREALGRGVSMAGLAIAWLLGVPEVTAVVIGPTRLEPFGRGARGSGRDLRARRVDALRMGSELVLAARAGRHRVRIPRLPRAWPRLPGVQPARGRLARGQVPPRSAVSRGVANVAAAGWLPEVRERRDVRRARRFRARGARPGRLDGGARDRLAPRRRRCDSGDRRTDARGAAHSGERGLGVGAHFG